MIYLLLAIAAGLTILGLYRFLMQADKRQIRALMLAAAAVGIALAALWLAVTGRLPAAMTILIALWPIVSAWLHNKMMQSQAPATSAKMTIKEAYEVLGLSGGAKEDEIKAAYLRLMKKVHPDQAGSDWLAQKINAAKDLLIDNQK
jgi:DnaJ-domain-containing protein 1